VLRANHRVRPAVRCTVWLGTRLHIPDVHGAAPFPVGSSLPDRDRTSLGCNRRTSWVVHRYGIIA
jgi:hypothetical protein